MLVLTQGVKFNEALWTVLKYEGMRLIYVYAEFVRGYSVV